MVAAGRNLFNRFSGSDCQAKGEVENNSISRPMSRFSMLDGWIRRRIVWYLKNKQVLAWQAKRYGECARCGKCCELCLAHDAKNKRCRIYGIRPSICKAFPLTPEDINKISTCGFYFKK